MNNGHMYIPVNLSELRFECDYWKKKSLSWFNITLICMKQENKENLFLLKENKHKRYSSEISFFIPPMNLTKKMSIAKRNLHLVFYILDERRNPFYHKKISWARMHLYTRSLDFTWVHRECGWGVLEIEGHANGPPTVAVICDWMLRVKQTSPTNKQDTHWHTHIHMLLFLDLSINKRLTNQIHFYATNNQSNCFLLSFNLKKKFNFI